MERTFPYGVACTPPISPVYVPGAVAKVAARLVTMDRRTRTSSDRVYMTANLPNGHTVQRAIVFVCCGWVSWDYYVSTYPVSLRVTLDL